MTVPDAVLPEVRATKVAPLDVAREAGQGCEERSRTRPSERRMQRSRNRYAAKLRECEHLNPHRAAFFDET